MWNFSLVFFYFIYVLMKTLSQTCFMYISLSDDSESEEVCQQLMLDLGKICM